MKGLSIGASIACERSTCEAAGLNGQFIQQNENLIEVFILPHGFPISQADDYTY